MLLAPALELALGWTVIETVAIGTSTAYLTFLVFVCSPQKNASRPNPDQRLVRPNRLNYFLLFGTGVVTSPNYARSNYPNNLAKTETIQVEDGKIVSLEFTTFEVYACHVATCPCDFVKITDGDETILLDKSCGYTSVDPSNPMYFKPPTITSNTNMIKIYFETDGDGVSLGWSISWIAVTPGLLAPSGAL